MSINIIEVHAHDLIIEYRTWVNEERGYSRIVVKRYSVPRKMTPHGAICGFRDGGESLIIFNPGCVDYGKLRHAVLFAPPFANDA